MNSPFNKKLHITNRLSNSYSFRLLENKQKFLSSLTNSSNNLDNIDISNDSDSRNSQSNKTLSELLEEDVELLNENDLNYITPNKANNSLTKKSPYKYQII